MAAFYPEVVAGEAGEVQLHLRHHQHTQTDLKIKVQGREYAILHETYKMYISFFNYKYCYSYNYEVLF